MKKEYFARCFVVTLSLMLIIFIGLMFVPVREKSAIIRFHDSWMHVFTDGPDYEFTWKCTTVDGETFFTKTFGSTYEEAGRKFDSGIAVVAYNVYGGYTGVYEVGMVGTEFGISLTVIVLLCLLVVCLARFRTPLWEFIRGCIT